MLASAAADSLRRLRAVIETTFCPLTLAQRARCAAAMRVRPAAEIPPLRDDPVRFSAESALVRRSSSDMRRVRSCSSCLSTEVRLAMADHCTRPGVAGGGGRLHGPAGGAPSFPRSRTGKPPLDEIQQCFQAHARIEHLGHILNPEPCFFACHSKSLDRAH